MRRPRWTSNRTSRRAICRRPRTSARNDPDIIVLDEATAALDPQSQDKLMELLSRQPEHTTLVSVGHRPELEAFHSRKIVLQRRRGGARLVSDVRLESRPRGRLLRRILGRRPATQRSARR